MAPRLTLRRAVLSAAAVLLLTARAQGQSTPTPWAEAASDSSTAQVETRLERDRTRVRGDVRTRVRLRAGPWQVRAEQRTLADGFGSLRTENGRRAYDWRDDLWLAVEAWRPLGAGRRLGASSFTSWLPQSRVTRHETFLALAFRPEAGLRATARAGAALDARPGALGPVGEAVPLRQDAGPALGLDVQYADENAAPGLVLDGRASGALLGARRAGDVLGQARYRLAQRRVNVRADARYRLTRRDAYNAVPFSGPPRPVAEAVEATTSDTLDARLDADLPLATLPVAGPVRLAVAGALGRTNRRLRTPGALPGALAFDTDFARQTLDLDAALVVDRPGLSARAGLRTGAARETRRLANGAALPPIEAARKADLLGQTDFDRGTTALVGALRVERGRFFALVDAERSILRVDTPDANADDRDEARTYGRALVQLALFDGFAVRTEAVGTDLHTVYLRRARSAESQRQRTVQLRPGVDATFGRNTHLSLGTEVRATYTRDDFTLPGRDRADQSAREWRLESAFDHTFASGPLAGLRLDAEARGGDLRLGRLLPDRFAEVPYDTLRTVTLAAFVSGGYRWRYRVGWRHFRRSDAERALSVPFARPDGTAATFTRAGQSVFVQTGPSAALMLPLARGSEVHLEGWYAVQRTRAVLSGPPPPAADAEAIARAARGVLRLQPTVVVAARWRVW